MELREEVNIRRKKTAISFRRRHHIKSINKIKAHYQEERPEIPFTGPIQLLPVSLGDKSILIQQ